MNARPAGAADLPTIARIYNEGIADRVATFETEPRDTADLTGWLDPAYPCLVVEDAGEVVAFARASAYSSRACYAGIADFSVYVAREARGRGYGAAALSALMESCRAAGFHKLTSRVFVENAASRRLHAKLGFREVGTHLRHAQLDGVWRDVVTVEVLL